MEDKITEKGNRMNGFDKVIEDLKKNYETAKRLSFVNDPMNYALDQTWKEYEGKRYGIERMESDG